VNLVEFVRNIQFMWPLYPQLSCTSKHCCQSIHLNIWGYIYLHHPWWLAESRLLHSTDRLLKSPSVCGFHT